MGELMSGIQPQRRGSIRYGELEGIEGMSVFLVEGPAYRLVECLDGGKSLLGNVSHDRVHNFALVVTLFAPNNILG
jgi:hypothetical protein